MSTEEAARYPESPARNPCAHPHQVLRVPCSLCRVQQEVHREVLARQLLVLTPAHRPDLQAQAVQLEHETFQKAKTANLYKASVLKKVGLGQGQGGRAYLLAQGREGQAIRYPLAPRAIYKRRACLLGPAGDVSSPPCEDSSLSSVQFLLVP